MRRRRPQLQPFSSSFSLYRMILPDPVRGISAIDVHRARHLVGRELRAAVREQRLGLDRLRRRAAPRTAAGTSPRCSCGTPTTAQSSTGSNVFTTSSISAGAMFCPPRMISSFSRPVMVRKPFSSAFGEIAGVVPAVAQRLRGLLRLVEIAGHHVRAAHDQLALLAGVDIASARRIDDAHGEARHRKAARAEHARRRSASSSSPWWRFR